MSHGLRAVTQNEMKRIKLAILECKTRLSAVVSLKGILGKERGDEELESKMSCQQGLEDSAVGMQKVGGWGRRHTVWSF